MSKIVSMSSGAIDPIAQSKRVFFRPSTTGDVLKVGDSVCYNWDLAADHKERTGVVRPPTDEHLGGAGTAYAEGAQTYTGRLFIVEKPDSENLQNYAGVVKCLGPKVGADGDMIEIFVPNGAVVPVRAGIYCYKGVTVLAAQDGSYSLENPVYGKAFATVAIAMETIDRTTDGLVWARLLGPNYFSNGNYDIPLRTGDGITSGTIRIFERDISCRGEGTSQIQATVFRTRLKGADISCPDGGALLAEVFTEGQNDSPADPINALCANIVFGYGSILDGSQGNIDAYALKASLNEAVGYGATRTSSVVTALLCHCALDDAADGRVGQMGFTSGGTGTVDNFLIADNAISVAQNADGGTKDTNDTCALFLEILIGATTYWIPTYTDAELTAG